ncbi:hypothetical protein OPT61_g10711 [Boeremia exigua]|uniref:Uncharacterized protein n=1 Tax=Boeremia exigua TaxID=749465 RepID=A0ACC2HN89_9PLEO|nr:hypothetical protein OPT61_g10711 [Boeremia exigua]
MPSSAFRIPDNAPPAPTPDHSKVLEPPVAQRTTLIKNKDKSPVALPREQALDTETSVSDEPATSKGQATSNKGTAPREDYTVDQLAAMFTKTDWEDLYAFVGFIDRTAKHHKDYESAWIDWAKDKDNQTVEQWQQYYEKVVRPQWLKDPVSKREQIRRTVRAARDPTSSPAKTPDWSQTQDSAVTASQAELPASTEPSKRTVSNVLPSDPKLASESTAQQETPRYIRDGHESALKRIRGEADAAPESNETLRPAKVRRRLSLSPTLVGLSDIAGTQEQSLKVSSVGLQKGTHARRQPNGTSHSPRQDRLSQAVDEAEEEEEVIT